MKKGYFIAQGLKRINPVLIAAIALALVGCSHSNESQFSLAPPPPAYDPGYSYGPAQPPRLMAFNGQAIPFPSHISLSDAGMPQQETLYPGTKAALKSEGSGKKCRIQDRFDRDALIAYQWGENRIGLDVDGLNMGSSEIEAVKLQYTLKLQPHKTRKEKCRYESNWQGLLGSGYNEMFLREKDTMWDQLDKIGDQVEEAVDKVF